MTAEGFAEVVSVLKSAFGLEFNADQHRVWWGAMLPIPDDAAMWATVELVRTLQRPAFPQPRDVYLKAQDFVRRPPAEPEAPPALTAGPAARPSTAQFLKKEAERIAALPDGGDGIPQAVLLTAESVYAKHPDWTVVQVYGEVRRASHDRGPFADFWRITRGRTPKEAGA